MMPLKSRQDNSEIIIAITRNPCQFIGPTFRMKIFMSYLHTPCQWPHLLVLSRTISKVLTHKRFRLLLERRKYIWELSSLLFKKDLIDKFK
jgi:hypothetical protein